MDVGEWLRSLGLGQYEATLRDNEIDDAVLSDLTDGDLEKLGVPMGHRKRLLKAIVSLGSTETTAKPTNPAPTLTSPDVAERRQLTVMFCDLVGSTAMSARLDPEDMRGIIIVYHRCCATLIERNGGFVAKYMGDGVLAYFGYPQAHEHDAERAVHAGLAIVEAATKLVTAGSSPLHVRIGIATGLVVVGDLVGLGEAQERGVVGDAPNLAARLQSIAAPDSVVIAEGTRKLLGNLFELQDLGTKDLKGIAGPVRAWAVEGLSTSESRFEAVHAARLTDFVGREQEIGVLLDRKQLAWHGDGQIVLVSGEAGIGKSRLLAQLSRHVAAEAHTRLRYQCSPYHRGSALHPFIAQLERAAEFRPDNPPERQLDKLEAVLAMGTARVQAVAPLFAALLSLPFGERYSPLTLSPAQQRRQTLAALLDQLEGLARQQSILLLFEDVHWADPTSIELLDLTVDRVRHSPVLAIFSFRPEFEPPWAGLPNVTVLALGRLDQSHVQTMVQQVTGGRRLPAEVMRQIIRKTDGIPLFVEELTKTVLEAGILVEDVEGYRLDGPLPPLAIPTTLHDSLMARLDRLAAVKEIAQVAAAIGREFSYPLLRTVVGRDEAALRSALSQLEAAELVFHRGELPEALYTFKHALVRDAAYESLLKSRRQVLHRHIAEAMRHQFPAFADTEPEIVAHHFTQAGLAEAAIEWWGKAGERALRSAAYEEAIAHLEKALALAEGLVESPTQRLLRLRLQIAHGQALIHARGYAAPETTAAFSRGREFALGIEDVTERFPVYYGLWAGSWVRGEIAQMREPAEAFLDDTGNRPESPEAGIAHRLLGSTCWLQGDFIGARTHLETSLAIYDSERDRDLAFRFAQDTGVSAMIVLALTLWPLGEIDSAGRCAEKAVTQAVRSEHIATLAFAKGFKSLFEMMRRDAGCAAQEAETLLDLAHEHAMPQWLAIGTFTQGWARWHAGDRAAGEKGMRKGMALFREQRIRFPLPLCAILFAEVEADAERIEAAVAILDDTLADAERTGQHHFAAEVHRQRGELLFRDTPNDTAVAEVALTRAIEIARSQRTRTFELRASTSLARLWCEQGKRTEAHDLLAPVYGWFTEGFDTLDLREAKTLLDALAS